MFENSLLSSKLLQRVIFTETKIEIYLKTFDSISEPTIVLVLLSTCNHNHNHNHKHTHAKLPWYGSEISR